MVSKAEEARRQQVVVLKEIPPTDPNANCVLEEMAQVFTTQLGWNRDPFGFNQLENKRGYKKEIRVSRRANVPFWQEVGVFFAWLSNTIWVVDSGTSDEPDPQGLAFRTDILHEEERYYTEFSKTQGDFSPKWSYHGKWHVSRPFFQTHWSRDSGKYPEPPHEIRPMCPKHSHRFVVRYSSGSEQRVWESGCLLPEGGTGTLGWKSVPDGY
jgi:hypothetical protein